MTTATLTNPAEVAADLEARIKATGAEAIRLAIARDSLGARRLYVVMAGLIAQRTPETVRRMEAARGLQ